MNIFCKFCGYYCTGMACVGIYFFIVLAIFQNMNNMFMIQELQEGIGASGTNGHFISAFVICAIVSITHQIIC